MQSMDTLQNRPINHSKPRPVSYYTTKPISFLEDDALTSISLAAATGATCTVPTNNNLANLWSRISFGTMNKSNKKSDKSQPSPVFSTKSSVTPRVRVARIFSFPSKVRRSRDSTASYDLCSNKLELLNNKRSNGVQSSCLHERGKRTHTVEYNDISHFVDLETQQCEPVSVVHIEESARQKGLQTLQSNFDNEKIHDASHTPVQAPTFGLKISVSHIPLEDSPLNPQIAHLLQEHLPARASTLPPQFSLSYQPDFASIFSPNSRYLQDENTATTSPMSFKSTRNKRPRIPSLVIHSSFHGQESTLELEFNTHVASFDRLGLYIQESSHCDTQCQSPDSLYTLFSRVDMSTMSDQSAIVDSRLSVENNGIWGTGVKYPTQCHFHTPVISEESFPQDFPQDCSIFNSTKSIGNHPRHSHVSIGNADLDAHIKHVRGSLGNSISCSQHTIDTTLLGGSSGNKVMLSAFSTVLADVQATSLQVKVFCNEPHQAKNAFAMIVNMKKVTSVEVIVNAIIRKATARNPSFVGQLLGVSIFFKRKNLVPICLKRAGQSGLDASVIPELVMEYLMAKSKMYIRCFTAYS